MKLIRQTTRCRRAPSQIPACCFRHRAPLRRAGSDLFNLVPADPGVNSARGNLAFGYPDPEHPNYAGPGYYPEAPLVSRDSLRWLPPEADRGFIARALFYMATRYRGRDSEPALSLTDNPPAASPWGTEMGELSVLVEWNRRHPPSAFEERRNRLIHENFQHNRNPFIDYPDLVDAVFTSHLYLAPGTWRVEHFTFDELNDEEISGWEADPDGDGKPNILEYGFGSDPRQAGAAPPVQIIFHDGWASATFRMVKEADRCGLEYIFERSEDLTNWETILPDWTAIGDDGPWHIRVILILPMPAGVQQQFVRVRIDRQ